LRVTTAVPQTAALRLAGAHDAAPQAELPGVAAPRIAPVRWQVLPAMDPATHTVQVRLDLPAGTAAVPGMFARVWLPDATDDTACLSVPVRAVVRRAELTAVYVVSADGRPLLRQVRLGPTNGDRVEVLSGLSAGERVALDPQAAARVR
jgi:multidrug efflux pump subunit AcrA (membrane-fusion protein)